MTKTKLTSKFRVLGVMSGTSLDGLDLALVEFSTKKDKWFFSIAKGVCIEYPFPLKKALKAAVKSEAGILADLDIRLGSFIGDRILDNFPTSKIDFISSHGHTIFHQPHKGITLQIGNGQCINERTGLRVISDFRSEDVALGGQGAPLVPIGDELLFSDYDACLNLGGIANISFRKEKKRIAYDVIPFNMALNHLAQQLGKDYDQDGELAKKGSIDQGLLKSLDQLDYYQKPYPKSLGIEDFQEHWLPHLSTSHNSIEDTLRTYIQHAAQKIAEVINRIGNRESKTLITGGGAHHNYFIGILKDQVKGDLIVPEQNLIDYKEAITFAFLGLLKHLGKDNCLASVTGAQKDSCSGKMFGF